MTLEDTSFSLAGQSTGRLSRCPLEIRWEIYELVMSFHGQIFELEFEGPTTLHVPVTTLDALRHRPFPNIARVCKEMRNYVLRVHSRIEVNFTCGLFGINAVHKIMAVDMLVFYSLWQKLLEFKHVTAYFHPQYDQISFKPHKWTRVPKDYPAVSIKKDDYGDLLHEYNMYAPDAQRFLTLAVSSALVTAPRTAFEELVLAQWDEASANHTETILEYEMVTHDDIRQSEDIMRVIERSTDGPERVNSVCRSYGSASAWAVESDIESLSSLQSEARNELDEWLEQAQSIYPQHSPEHSSLAREYQTQLLLLAQRDATSLASVRHEGTSNRH